jgi:2-methylcitrate dehydratase PrpD
MRRTHPVLDAFFAAVGNLRPNPSAIRKIRVETSSFVAELGKVYRPESETAAQGSIPFVLGLAALKGIIEVSDFDEAAIRRKEVLDLASRVEICVLDRFENRTPTGDFRWAARVIVGLADGKELAADVEFPRGDPESPLSFGEVKEKIQTLLLKKFPPDQVQKISDCVTNLEREESIRNLIQLTCPGR